MPSPPRRVLILSSIPDFTVDLARTADLAGFLPFVGTDRAWARDRLSIHARRRLLLPTPSPEAAAEAFTGPVNAFVAANRIDLVVAADTRFTRLLAAHAAAIRGAAVFPAPSRAVFDQLYDKWSFYRLLADHGIPTPRTVLLAKADDLRSLDLGFPVMLKPTLGESGKGVRRVDDAETLRREVLEAEAGGTLPLLVQAFVPGPDIDLNLLADRGELRASLVQQRIGPAMRFPRDERVVALGADICRACGYSGVGHVDMRIDERTGEVTVIEFNPRFWGTMLFAAWFGVNLLALGAPGAPAPGVTPLPEPGDCPWLGAAPGNLLRWARGGFRPLGDSESQRRGWAQSVRDPLPELWESLLEAMGRNGG